MMPVVRINDATFASLSTLKTWFGTKTPSDTIDQIVREAMEQLGIALDDDEDASLPVASGEVMEFTTTPGLSFTKPVSAVIDGQTIQNPRWSAILIAMVTHLKGKGLAGEKLSRELQIPSKTTSYEDEGFKYHTDLGLSIQGQSAADAWKEADRIAKKWRIPIEVTFVWRDNPKAQHPGRSGILRSGR
jgi:hypothetical protein